MLVNRMVSRDESRDELDVASLQRERDLYLQLLNLGRQTHLTPFLKEALALIVELGGARQGYLEVYDDDGGDGSRWSIAHGFSDDEVQQVRAATSQGIVAESLATGQTITTQSALLDPRFDSRESVRIGRIEAVLCAPIGDDPPRGVLYLQGPSTSRLFADDGRARAEIFARHLAPLVDRLLAEQRRSQATDPTRPLRESLRLTNVIGRSPAFAAVLKQAAMVAPLDVTVLLTGESGTGKGQLARVIHDNSPRAAREFVTLNCATLSNELIISELFGHEKGAFTGATDRRIGRFESADGGTVFLDEIGDVSKEVQTKLLRVLQERTFERAGSNKPITVDVRIIAATNADLQRAMAEGRFREDLFYRLQVLPIRMPSLGERREDIRELAAFFCVEACRRHGLPALELSRNALRAAESAAWPGNIRQLGHAVEAAAIRAAGEGAQQIERTHLFPEAPAEPQAASAATFQEATRTFHKTLLSATLAETDWNVVEAAQRLDLSRAHIYNLIRALGLERATK